MSKFNINDNVIYIDKNREHISTITDIWKDSFGNVMYEIILPERNVMLESLEKVFLKLNDNSGFSKNDFVRYKKGNSENFAIIETVDIPSRSAQIRIFLRGVKESSLTML